MHGDWLRSGVLQWTEASGYVALTAGEYCAEGVTSPKVAVADWMTCAGHKSNILSGKYTHIVVAPIKSKEGKTYSTQVFARPFEAKNLIHDQCRGHCLAVQLSSPRRRRG